MLNPCTNCEPYSYSKWALRMLFNTSRINYFAQRKYSVIWECVSNGFAQRGTLQQHRKLCVICFSNMTDFKFLYGNEVFGKQPRFVLLEGPVHSEYWSVTSCRSASSFGVTCQGFETCICHHPDGLLFVVVKALKNVFCKRSLSLSLSLQTWFPFLLWISQRLYCEQFSWAGLCPHTQ